MNWKIGIDCYSKSVFLHDNNVLDPIDGQRLLQHSCFLISSSVTTGDRANKWKKTVAVRNIFRPIWRVHTLSISSTSCLSGGSFQGPGMVLLISLHPHRKAIRTNSHCNEREQNCLTIEEDDSLVDEQDGTVQVLQP